jgi:hypothetical protein
MRKFLLASAALLALGTTAQAGCTGCVGMQTFATTGVTCSDCVLYNNGNGLSYQPGESTLAAWAARKAVENQQSAWWDEKKVEKLTREELDARAERLATIRKWADTLSNHIFASAYRTWAAEREQELATRRQTLDQLDVALSLVKGLPTPPEGK